MSTTTSVTIRRGEIVLVPMTEPIIRPRFMTIQDLPPDKYTSTLSSMRELNQEIENHNKTLEEKYTLAADLIRAKRELEETKRQLDEITTAAMSMGERYEILLKEKEDRLDREMKESKESSTPFGWIKKKLHNL